MHEQLQKCTREGAVSANGNANHEPKAEYGPEYIVMTLGSSSAYALGNITALIGEVVMKSVKIRC